MDPVPLGVYSLHLALWNAFAFHSFSCKNEKQSAGKKNYTYFRTAGFDDVPLETKPIFVRQTSGKKKKVKLSLSLTN
jgi:hypothetical protein